ncbi:MAG: hypothetical protein V1753_02255, partial [Pseudomonadota bacterium]
LIQESPFADTGIENLDAHPIITSIGCSYSFKDRSVIEISFSEDPNTAALPDFMLGAAYRQTF